MKPYTVLYVPIGVPTFHMESAKQAFEASKQLLCEIEPQTLVPNEMLLSIPLLIEHLERANPDLVIVQNVTFANSQYMTEILKRSKAPIVLWTLREPVIDGGRLRLNSLTGAFSAGFAHYHMREDFLFYLFGSPSEAKIQNRLKKIITVSKLKHAMNDMNLLMIGHTPQGFGFGRALDLDMANTFGVNVLAIESRELTAIAKQYTLEDVASEQAIAMKSMLGIEGTIPKNREDFFKLFKAYADYIQKNNIKAIASRCWPDFFTDYGTPVCGVLGLLNDKQIAAACEADAYGALSMYIGQELSKQPTYLGDPVSLDEQENTITFWHCGTAACSLARKEPGALTGVHPNRKIGPTMEFGLKASKQATLFRIGRKPNGEFRFFLSSGEILDKPQQFLGTSVVVKVKQDVTEMITEMVQDGWEPHYVVIYGDIKEELLLLADFLGLECHIY